MSYCTEHSRNYSTSTTSALSTASTTSCGPNCSCRTVSSVGSTTPRFARVQFNPHEPRETFESPSINNSLDDLLQDSDAPDDDTSKQDFAFDDVFEYDRNEHPSATRSADNAVSGPVSQHKGQTDFSSSPHSGQIKGPGQVKMTRAKSVCPRPRVARVKSGCRPAGRYQYPQP